MTPGGRAGDVYLVTSLADAGPGSLRAACEADGPRTVVINVSGTVELDAPIEIQNPFITISGQRAPGYGVCLKNYGLRVAADDVVVRYLRVRPGAGPGIEVTGGERVIVDHCTVGWTSDDAVSISGVARDVTVQWSLVAESLADSKGIAVNIGAGPVSLHHNYLAHHASGFPFVNAMEKEPGPLVDARNNVLYDWVSASAELSDGYARLNLLANIYKAGPSTESLMRGQGVKLHSTNNRLHIDQNELAGSSMGSANNFFMVHRPENFSTRHHGDMLKTDGPFEAAPVKTLDTQAALSRVLGDAGATRPRRDAIDERVVAQYRLGGGTVIADLAPVDGWPEYPPAEPLPDSDGDGMPDDWEEAAGLDPADEGDANGDRDGDGYTNIEEWLNSAGALPANSR